MELGGSEALEPLYALLEGLRTHSRGRKLSPHKYVLLLALANAIGASPEHANRFTFQELEPVFLAQFDRLFPSWPSARRLLEHPFYHLQNDGYWHLQLKRGKEVTFAQYQRTRLTRRRLIKTVEHGYLDESVISSLQTKASQDLIETRFLGALSQTRGG